VVHGDRQFQNGEHLRVATIDQLLEDEPPAVCKDGQFLTNRDTRQTANR